MNYLISMDCNGMAVHLTGSDVKGFKKCCMSDAMEDWW